MSRDFSALACYRLLFDAILLTQLHTQTTLSRRSKAGITASIAGRVSLAPFFALQIGAFMDELDPAGDHKE